MWICFLNKLKFAPLLLLSNLTSHSPPVYNFCFLCPSFSSSYLSNHPSSTHSLAIKSFWPSYPQLLHSSWTIYISFKTWSSTHRKNGELDSGTYFKVPPHDLAANFSPDYSWNLEEGCRCDGRRYLCRSLSVSLSNSFISPSLPPFTTTLPSKLLPQWFKTPLTRPKPWLAFIMSLAILLY